MERRVGTRRAPANAACSRGPMDGQDAAPREGGGAFHHGLSYRGTAGRSRIETGTAGSGATDRRPGLRCPPRTARCPRCPAAAAGCRAVDRGCAPRTARCPRCLAAAAGCRAVDRGADGVREAGAGSRIRECRASLARDLTASLRIFRRSSFAWGPDGNTAVTTPAPAGSLTSREWGDGDGRLAVSGPDAEAVGPFPGAPNPLDGVAPCAARLRVGGAQKRLHGIPEFTEGSRVPGERIESFGQRLTNPRLQIGHRGRPGVDHQSGRRHAFQPDSRRILVRHQPPVDIDAGTESPPDRNPPVGKPQRPCAQPPFVFTEHVAGTERMVLRVYTIAYTCLDLAAHGCAPDS